MPLLATLLVVACASGAGSPSDGPTPTVVAESMVVFATAEAERKSAAGNCAIEPNAQCEGADFEGVDLGAEFLGNNLNDGLDLTGANLRSANMKDIDLYLADLTGADLTGADLTNSNLSFANLRGSDMEGAILCNTLMPDGGTANESC